MGASLSYRRTLEGSSDPRGILLRVLVFLCFFNFSGLNNGYTYLTVVSPLDASASVNLTASVARTFYRVAAPGYVFHLFDQGRTWAARSALWTSSLISSIGTGSPNPAAIQSAQEQPFRPIDSSMAGEAGQSMGSELHSLQVASAKQEFDRPGKDGAVSVARQAWLPRTRRISIEMKLVMRDNPDAMEYRIGWFLPMMWARGQLTPDEEAALSGAKTVFTTDSVRGIGFFICGVRVPKSDVRKENLA